MKTSNWAAVTLFAVILTAASMFWMGWFGSSRHGRASAAGRTPHLARRLPHGQWEARETPGTFTLPAHLAFFHGFLPTPPGPGLHPRLFALEFEGSLSTAPTTYVFRGVDNLIAGFLRLRLPAESPRPEIGADSALVRELHVYGAEVPLEGSGSVQHRGLGLKLLKEAENGK